MPSESSPMFPPFIAGFSAGFFVVRVDVRTKIQQMFGLASGEFRVV